jgi:hypothetical protein
MEDLVVICLFTYEYILKSQLKYKLESILWNQFGRNLQTKPSLVLVIITLHSLNT